MVAVAQLVRASDCGSEGRGFESPLPPMILKDGFRFMRPSFFCVVPEARQCYGAALDGEYMGI